MQEDYKSARNAVVTKYKERIKEVDKIEEEIERREADVERKIKSYASIDREAERKKWRLRIARKC